MIRTIVRDPLFLAQRSEPAGPEDAPIARDLLDTLRAHLDHCAGLAANMIGCRKRIIAVSSGPFPIAMLNPEIVAASGPYEAEEGCLSLDGARKATRFREITVRYRDPAFQERTARFQSFAAQAIQHEIDHLNGILI